MTHCSKRYLQASTLALVAAISLAGCNNGNNENQNTTPEKTTSKFMIPYMITIAALPNSGTLSASIFMDGSSTATATKNIAVTASSVSFNLDVATGDHTVTIVLNYADSALAGSPFELARATSSSISVTAGSSQNVSFPAYTYNDTDHDGVPDITELSTTVGTDPGDSTCILDKSVIGDTTADGCTLG